jgi:hypothetical protein
MSTNIPTHTSAPLPPITRLNTLEQAQQELGLGKYDPMLQELWATKAQLNRAANYDIRLLGKQAHELANSVKFAGV